MVSDLTDSAFGDLVRRFSPMDRINKYWQDIVLDVGRELFGPIFTGIG